MKLVNDQEVDVIITAVAPVGSMVEVVGSGTTGFIDQVKHPAWNTAGAFSPQVGERLHAVVLDDSRTPPRLSALQQDIEIARVLRERESRN